MVHRRLLKDDGLGVMEPLNETDSGCSSYPTQVPDWASLCAPLPPCARSGAGVVSRGLLILSLEPPALAARVWRPLAHANYMQVGMEYFNPCYYCMIGHFRCFIIVSNIHHVTLTFSLSSLLRQIFLSPPLCPNPSARPPRPLFPCQLNC
jgi:hypothetical protein